MEERERLMFEHIIKQRHAEARLILEWIRYLKDICAEQMFCSECKFSVEDKCIFTSKKTLQELDEIEITERICK